MRGPGWRRAALTAAWLLSPAAAHAQRGTVDGAVSVPSARITGVVVYLVPDSGAAAPAVPVAEPAGAGMDQRDLRFVPRVVVVTPGSTVTFSNTDRVRHNVFHPMQHSDGFDLGTWPPGETRQYTFKAQGAYVILCNVHPEMVGYVVVVATPYHAVADDEGRFRIEGVAPGSYRLRTWHRWLATHDERVVVTADGVAHVTLALKYGDAGEPSAGR